MLIAKRLVAGALAMCMTMTSFSPVLARADDLPLAESEPIVSMDAETEEITGPPDSIASSEITDEAASEDTSSETNSSEENPASSGESADSGGLEPTNSEGQDMPDAEEPDLPESTPESASQEEVTEPKLVAFSIKDPEAGDTAEANIGDTVTFTA